LRFSVTELKAKEQRIGFLVRNHSSTDFVKKSSLKVLDILNLKRYQSPCRKLRWILIADKSNMLVSITLFRLNFID